MLKLEDIPWFAAQGRLTVAQRWRLVLKVVGRQLMARRRHVPGGVLSDFSPADLERLAVDGPIAHAALSVATQALPEWLLQHSLRTYLWGRLLALTEGRTVDPATLYAASLLHDLGLTAQAATPNDACFAIRGARYARRILLAAGASPRQAESIAVAIALHLDPSIPATAGEEARFLHAGAGFDVLGARFADVPKSLRQTVLDRHPRQGMKTCLCAAMLHQAEHAPHTRIGLYVHHLRFLTMIRKAPFDE